MPESIASPHAFFTLIAIGILFGLGFNLVGIAVSMFAEAPPARRYGTICAALCLLLLAIAWLI